MCEICSKLTRNTAERRSNVFVNFEQILQHCSDVFSLGPANDGINIVLSKDPFGEKLSFNTCEILRTKKSLHERLNLYMLLRFGDRSFS